MKHRLAFEVRAETMALFRDLQAAVRADLGGGADDDAILYEIARRALVAPPTRPCQLPSSDHALRHLRPASIEAAGASHDVDATVTEMAACDAQLLGDVLEPRAEGGGHDPERLLVLCGAHHRAVHAGTLAIGGDATTGFACRHADGTAYGAAPNLSAVDVARRVFGMLEHMGFTATRARALVDEALRRVAPDDASVLLREALRAT